MALAQLIKQGVVASVNNKKEQMKDSIKESVMSMPLIGGMLRKKEDEKSQKEERQLQGSFTKISDSTNEQVQILKKSNIVLTQISDNVYNIAGKLGAELSSLDEVKQIFKDRAKQEAIGQQKASAMAEESNLERKMREVDEVRGATYDKTKGEDKKQSGGIFDFLKNGKLPIKDIIKKVLGGGLSFLRTAGGFLLRGLTLFTNPIGIAVAIVGTIGYGIYKYFTDDEFKDTVDNLFETAKKFIAEKFGQAGDLFSQYIIDPVVNFLSGVKDKILTWMISTLKPFEDVPGLGRFIKPSVEALEKMKSAPVASAAPTVTATDQKEAASEVDRLSKRYPAATDKQTTATPEQNAALEADITKYVNLKDSSIDLTGMDPAVKKRLAAVSYEYFNSTGKKIQINSAFRDPKEQAKLFAKYGSPRAARPGKSKHEVGLAVDMNSADANKATSMGLFDKYGFQRPIASEPWHVEAKEARNSVADNPTNPGQAVLVSNGGKPTIPSGGVAVNDNQLKQAVPVGGGAETAQTASDLPSAEPVKTESGASTNLATDSGTESSAKSAAAPAEPVSAEPSTGSQVAQASMDVEQGYSNQQPSVSNVDNSSSSMSSTEQGTRFKIPSPVADRGSLDKMSFSYA